MEYLVGAAVVVGICVWAWWRGVRQTQGRK